jgi:hypothetical protein
VSADFGGEGGAQAVVDPSPEIRTPTPPQYATGAIKQDPDSLAVAVRTNIPDPDSDHDWGVMTVDRGGHYAGWDEVAGWADR